MNLHSNNNAIEKHDNETDEPLSFTKHLTKCFVCEKDTKVIYYDIKCIAGSCEKKCSETIKNVFNKSSNNKQRT